MTGQPTGEELGQVAYRAYGEITGFKNYQGLPMPEFDELGRVIKTAWMFAAKAVEHVLLTPPGSCNCGVCEHLREITL